MQTVSHPLLLEFRECIQTKTHIYIITELVKGKDLYEFVKDYDYLDEYDAAKICQQMIVGVRVLHSFEIVHRDLKPENIMVPFSILRLSWKKIVKKFKISKLLTLASATTFQNFNKKEIPTVNPFKFRPSCWDSQLYCS